jgi:hypothetical protein
LLKAIGDFMEFIIAMIFGAFVSNAVHITVNQEDCKKYNYEPKACKVSEALEKAGKK